MILDIEDGGMRSSGFFSRRIVPLATSAMISWRAVVSGESGLAGAAGAGGVAGALRAGGWRWRCCCCCCCCCAFDPSNGSATREAAARSATMAILRMGRAVMHLSLGGGMRRAWGAQSTRMRASGTTPATSASSLSASGTVAAGPIRTR